jgi:predicted nucleic acid-binding protein
MGQGFLIDTNVVIDHLSNRLPPDAASEIDKLPGIISVITRIELLGWYNATAMQLAKIKPFIDNARIINLSEEIIQQTITLRQHYKMKLPDAVVAATAIVHNYTLLTRNTVDFRDIKGLSFENPWLY